MIQIEIQLSAGLFSGCAKVNPREHFYILRMRVDKTTPKICEMPATDRQTIRGPDRLNLLFGRSTSQKYIKYHALVYATMNAFINKSKNHEKSIKN